ncbi:MAG TPA: hypothetical protein VE987_14890 [Polyangiaceae bacterium]|nr:hypothetical protein [Polyangiaceae bacterium]
MREVYGSNVSHAPFTHHCEQQSWLRVHSTETSKQRLSAWASP